MRWLTPWGTSLAIHALVLLPLALLVFVNSVNSERAPSEFGFASQLRDDVTALRKSDHAGDPFSSLKTDEPPSLSFNPDQRSDVYNVPELPAHVRLSTNFQPILSASVSPGMKPGVSGGQPIGPPSQPAAPFAGRRGDVKAKLVLKEGGTVESEKAVELGLDWIARHQRPDGAWSLDSIGQCVGEGCPQRFCVSSDTAATGLALLPMLGAGHTHLEKGRYQRTIGYGLKWLIKQQQKSGLIYNNDGPFNAMMYSHAIASMALCEAYGITGDKTLRTPVQRAVKFIVESQNRLDGGWRYYPGMPGDTSVFGWELFALRSASLAGLPVNKGTIRRCYLYLDNAAADAMGVTYAYRPGGEATPVMTAEALLIRQYLGWSRDTPAMLQGAGMVSAHLDESAERNIYYWYYATQLLHNLKGKEWERWNQRVRDGLISIQVRGKGCDCGSWDPELPEPDRWGTRAGRLYTTALSLLTLEVYYRYLPLYRDTDGEMAGTEETDFAQAAGGRPEAEKKPAAAAGAPGAPAPKRFNPKTTNSESLEALPKAAPSANRQRSTSSPK
jgi:hypothetical protein